MANKHQRRYLKLNNSLSPGDAGSSKRTRVLEDASTASVVPLAGGGGEGGIVVPTYSIRGGNGGGALAAPVTRMKD